MENQAFANDIWKCLKLGRSFKKANQKVVVTWYHNQGQL